ncbi:DUF1330 domain-containing protein [Alphaproteobacteria bacterium]|nr:DUF1330 domain-containing protein [Alphaproteobacteria bacterium]
MTAYMFVKAKITDPIKFSEYTKEMQSLVPNYGGKYLTKGAVSEVLEGLFDVKQKVLIAQYPSVNSIKKLWNSEEYKRIKKLREGACKVQVIVMNGE